MAVDDVVLRAENVEKSFGRQKVLRDISLSIARGTVTCLIGPSGSGKSTFLRCVNHLEKVDSGRIWVSGDLVGYKQRGQRLIELPEKEIARRRSRIGMVFQQFNVFPHMTALDNVMEAPVHVKHESRAIARERGMTLLAKVGLEGRGQSYPRQMSGGEQQRVAIARALAMEPELMLFDEPTSALDPELVGDVVQVMEGLASDGMTMLVVTHEMRFARDAADEVVFMADGVIVEAGAAHQVLTRPAHERTQAFLRRVF